MASSARDRSPSTADKGEGPRRQVFDDRVFDTVEIRPALLPVIRVSGYCDRLVRLEFDEFEWAGADRVLAHLAGRHMAGVDRRPSGSQHRQERGLRPLQMKGDLVVAFRGYFIEVAVPGFAWVETQLVARLSGQQVPGAFDVVGGERLAVMPSDVLAQRQGQL